MGNRKHIIVFVAVLVAALLGVGSASAASISPESLGVNVLPFSLSGGRLGPSDLSMGSGSGLGVVRMETTQGHSADRVVALAAAAHLRLAPSLGLPQQLAPAAAATAMALYTAAFAKRYGPGGTFWSQNPGLPYEPVIDYEIGNEPNLPLQYIQDSSHLHWVAPSSYALVYEAARTALHQVDPSGVAEVGGLADSGTPGVSLSDDERWLAALPAGQVDAVGYHPYTFPVSFTQMYTDTAGLRQWMNTHGMQNAPIEINEVGACDVLPQDTFNRLGCAPSIPSAQWGAFTAAFAAWALCSPALHVGQIQPFSWGDLSTTDHDAILALVSSEGALTPYGQDYLAEAHALTTVGCSRFSLSSVHVHRHRVTVTVAVTPAAGRVTVVARKGHRKVHLRLAHHSRTNSVLRFRARLAPGRWKVTVISTPGFGAPQKYRRTVTVRRR